MSKVKVGISKDGSPMHYSVGAVIHTGVGYLLIDRAKEPFGFAGVAGHIDEGETLEEALAREVFEESGLEVTGSELLIEEELSWNKCRRGANSHYWYIYECDVEGEISRSLSETKLIGEYEPWELTALNLEPAWRHWFRRLGVIQPKIMICSSMSFAKEMLATKKLLESQGYAVDIASDAEDCIANPDLNMSYEHCMVTNIIMECFQKIANSHAILVLNHPKNGIKGYVGGSVLMEIGLARYLGKKIFLLHDIPSIDDLRYALEIKLMQPTILNGDIMNLNQYI